MSRGPLRPGESLVEGLNHHERIARIERGFRGPGGVWEEIETLRAGQEQLRRDVADLKLEANRRQLPWYVRLFGLGSAS